MVNGMRARACDDTDGGVIWGWVRCHAMWMLATRVMTMVYCLRLMLHGYGMRCCCILTIGDLLVEHGDATRVMRVAEVVLLQCDPCCAMVSMFVPRRTHTCVHARMRIHVH